MHSSSPPTVGIVIPNWNRAATVEKALKAALLQTEPADEVIVIDDGSTDRSKEKIAAFCQGRPEIRYIDRKENIGLMATLNEGLEGARSDILYFGASDDQILDTACATARRLFARHPEAGILCGHAVARVDAEGRVFDQALWWSREERFFDPHEWAEAITYACPLSHSIFYRREALRAIGGFRLELQWHADWFSQHVLGFSCGACYTPEALSLRCLESDSYGERGIRDREGQRGVIAAAMRLLREEPFARVRSLFALSGTFAQFGTHALRVVIENPEFAELEDFKLVSFALAREMLLKQQAFFQEIGDRQRSLAEDRVRLEAMGADDGEAVDAIARRYPFRSDICRLAAERHPDPERAFVLLQRAHRINPFDAALRERLRANPLFGEVSLLE